MLGDKKLEVYQDRDRLEITLKWFTPIALFLLFFTVIWNAFLVFWYSMAISGGAWIMVLFPILHVAVGVYLTYYTLCLFFNKTFIDISGDYLTIRHTPIPWWKGNRRIPVNAIEQPGPDPFFQGEKRDQADFQDTLDLDDQPLRDLETRDPGWREEDLV